jgi:hypothetical protein
MLGQVGSNPLASNPHYFERYRLKSHHVLPKNSRFDKTLPFFTVILPSTNWFYVLIGNSGGSSILESKRPSL